MQCLGELIPLTYTCYGDREPGDLWELPRYARVTISDLWVSIYGRIAGIIGHESGSDHIDFWAGSPRRSATKA